MDAKSAKRLVKYAKRCDAIIGKAAEAGSPLDLVLRTIAESSWSGEMKVECDWSYVTQYYPELDSRAAKKKLFDSLVALGYDVSESTYHHVIVKW